MQNYSNGKQISGSQGLEDRKAVVYKGNSQRNIYGKKNSPLQYCGVDL